MTTKQPFLVTVAIITQEDNFLLIKRAREPFKDEWAFIGGCGAFEQTSDPLEAVKHEVIADINCRFNPTSLGYRYETAHVPSVVLYFTGTIKGTPHPNQKYVSEWKWVKREELKKMRLAFDQNGVVKEFFKRYQ